MTAELARMDVPALAAEIRLLRAERNCFAYALSFARQWTPDVPVSLDQGIAEILATLPPQGGGELVVAAPAEHTIWRAWYDGDGETLAHYASRDAGMGHVHHLLAQEEGATVQEIETRTTWRSSDPNSPENASTEWDCYLFDEDHEERPTGYVVSPVVVATRFVPPGGEH